MFRRNISFHPSCEVVVMTHTPCFFFRSVPAVYDAVPRWRFFPCFLLPAAAPPARHPALRHPRIRPWLPPRQQQAPPGPPPLPRRRRAPPPVLNLTKPRKLKPSSSRKPSAPTAVLRSLPMYLHGMLCATRRTSPPAPKLNQQDPSAWHCTRRTRPITPTLRHGYALSMTITWQAER